MMMKKLLSNSALLFSAFFVITSTTYSQNITQSSESYKYILTGNNLNPINSTNSSDIAINICPEQDTIKDTGTIISTDSNNDSFITFQASYVGDNAVNFTGGAETGSCYLGMANIVTGIDFQKAGLWKGGQFFIKAANIHARKSLAELTGDMQVTSNIDAGNHTYIQELWFKQVIKNVEFTAGLQDLNAEFANSEYGALYLNSSFGILPVISGNICAPIFPLTTLGFTAKWNITDNSSWLNAVYDGCPTDFTENPYNLEWHFKKGDGLIAISEYQHHVSFKELHGVYKIGVFSANNYIQRHKENVPDSLTLDIFGTYVYVDQKVWQHNNKSIGLFTQLGYSPSEESTNDIYFGFGANYSGLLSKKGADVLGIAIATGRFNKELPAETAIELTYQYQISDNIFIQPDLQYIINPCGTGIALDNSLVGNLRFGITF